MVWRLLDRSRSLVLFRDSRGRVVVKQPIPKKHDESEAGTQRWSETICDPVNATLTRISYCEVELSSREDRNSLSLNEGTALVRTQSEPHTTAIFTAWHGCCHQLASSAQINGQ